MKTGYFGLSVKGGFELQISALCGTSDGSAKLKTEFDSQLAQLKTQFETAKATAPPLLAELGEMLFARAKMEDKNQAVTFSTGIADSEQSKLEQLPAIVMMMAMTGGFGGMGGGPPAIGGPPSPFGASPGMEPGVGLPANIGMDSPEITPTPEIRMAGETETVEATTVEGLPDGMTLTARTAWASAPANPNDGGTSSMIEVLIDVTGEGLDTICAATGITSKTSKLDAGGSLKKSKRLILGGIDPQKTFLPFDVENPVPMEHPAQTLRVRLVVEPPTNDATKIDVFEGSFKFLTIGETQSLTIENAPQRAKRPLAEPEFKAGGVKLRRGDAGSVPETLRIECGKTHALGRATGTPGNVASKTEVEKGATVQRLYCTETDGKFPEDFQIDFKLYTDVKEQVVTFRFENVPLPTQESKPETQPQVQNPQGQIPQ